MVASAVDAALTNSGHTAQWLAQHSGMERQALTSRLRGDADFTMVDLANIAAALGVPVGSLTPSERPGASGAR